LNSNNSTFYIPGIDEGLWLMGGEAEGDMWGLVRGEVPNICGIWRDCLIWSSAWVWVLLCLWSHKYATHSLGNTVSLQL
jgi:hypothetical protein